MKIISHHGHRHGLIQADGEEEQEEEDDCAELDPTMYAMELITCNEKVREWFLWSVWKSAQN